MERAGLAVAAGIALAAGSAFPQSGSGASAAADACFAQYVENLNTCKRNFSGGMFSTGADRQLLTACIQAAAEIFEDCLHPPQT